MIELSIVIPTYNRLPQLQQLITGLENQTYPKDKFEAIIVSDGGSDGTAEFLLNHSFGLQLNPIIQKNAGAAVARNNGVAQARGRIILFIDDDILPDADLVQVHARSHESAGYTDMVLGPMLTPKDYKLSPWVAWEQAMLERQYWRMARGIYLPTSRQFYTGNASLKRDFFFMNGCFDPQFRRAEDVEFAYRAEKNGGHFIFNPQAKGYHYAQRSYESWMSIAYAYGQNDVAFTYEKGIDWLLPQVMKEYHQRNMLFRVVLTQYLDQHPKQENFIQMLKRIGVATYQRDLRKISQVIFSGIFNIRYYQGISDKLGGRDKFYSLTRQK